jgi:hypothetical protein
MVAALTPTGNTYVSQYNYSNVSVSSYANVIVGNLSVQGLYWQSNGGAVMQGINTGIYFGKTLAGTAPTLIDTLSITGNTRVSWKISATDNINSNYKVSTIDSLNTGANIYYSEYGVIQSNSAATVATFTSNITSGNINLWGVGNSNSVIVSFEREVTGNSTQVGYLNYIAGPQGPAGGGINYTTGTSSPSSPKYGDQWYNPSTDTWYEYMTDGTSTIWVDITGPTFTSTPGTNTLVGNVTVGNIIANVYGNVYGVTSVHSGNVIAGNLYVISNSTSNTTTRVEANIPHPFMLMGA